MAYKRQSTLVGLPDQDRGWEDVQAKTFTKWLNTKLESRDIQTMTSLSTDLSNGVRLCQLMEIMGDVTFPKYNKNPKIRVQKAENVNVALNFIRDRGVVLTNVGAEDIIDGNLKLILGMIWTLILRFTIADISEEGVTAKEGLLLWCQRKTADYSEVDVQNFTHSFRDGLALCALIHKHRPDLLDYDSLPKSDPHACTRLAFEVAQNSLDIPQLLDVEDLCDAKKPDERSVMTYVAQYFHAFSSMEHAEVNSRRVSKFTDVMLSAWIQQNDYERRARELLSQMGELQTSWTSAQFTGTYADAVSRLQEFKLYKSGTKRSWRLERNALQALLGNIKTKLKTYRIKEWSPAFGLGQQDLDEAWKVHTSKETDRARNINNEIRKAKESLRKKYAGLANGFDDKLQEITSKISNLSGELERQKTKVKDLQNLLGPMEKNLDEILVVEKECDEAKVEENDYTVFTCDDLKFELELLVTSVAKKMAFIDNQIVSLQHTNLTPAELEDFESTFRHFDKDSLNVLNVSDFEGALASLGITYRPEDIEQIHDQLTQNFGSVSYDAFLTFLREITEDTTSGDQLLEAFAGLANEKGFVTEMDLRMASLSQKSIDYLTQCMPRTTVDGVEEEVYDYQAYLEDLFTEYDPNHSFQDQSIG